MEDVDDLDYEMLSWLAAGNSVFRPREATHEAEEAFREGPCASFGSATVNR